MSPSGPSNFALTVLQVSTWERWGGAEAIALALAQGCRARGHDAWLAVGEAAGNDPNVVLIPNKVDRGIWYRACHSSEWLGRLGRTGKRVKRALDLVSEPGRLLDRLRGHEATRFPGTWRLLDLTKRRPDIVHAHNLHGEYFDLRALPWLSREVPLVLTLHDAWMLSGHCSHSFDCERWKTGCGRCPDLTIYPAVRRDATAYNWRRKQDIYANCPGRIYLATPSEWLMRRVKESMLASSIAESRVIPNGVDLKVFKPGDRRAARAELGLPQDAHVLLFAASGVRQNPFKDFQTLRDAVSAVAERYAPDGPGAPPLILVALGESAPPEQIGRARIQFVPFQTDSGVVAKYYRAADIYLHAARADTFPTTVLEALACGTPVVATAVGGIPEQVKSLSSVTLSEQGQACPAHDTQAATGVLVPPRAANELSHAIGLLLGRPDLRAALAVNAARDAANRFCADKQCEIYLDWYAHIHEQRVAQADHVADDTTPIGSERRDNEMSFTA